VLAAVLERDGQLLSATQDRHRALASADHLTILHAIWTAETTPAREQCYNDLVAASLPPCHQAQHHRAARAHQKRCPAPSCTSILWPNTLPGIRTPALLTIPVSQTGSQPTEWQPAA
jgi:hypothetical protein